MVGGEAPHFDWVGALGLIAVLTCLVLALAELTAPGDTAGKALPLLALGVAGAVLFVRHESRAVHPVLRMEPFRSLRFSGTQLASVAVNFACFANLLLLPYVLTREAGVAIAAAGLLLSAYPAGSVLGSLLAGRLVARLSRGPATPETSGSHRAAASSLSRLMSIGLLGASLGLLLTSAILFTWPAPWLLGLGMLASGIGQGIFQVGYMDATTSMLPIEERGVAGSLISVTRLFGIVLGATGIGWLQGVTQNYAISFVLLGAGLAAFAALFALTHKRSTRSGLVFLL